MPDTYYFDGSNPLASNVSAHSAKPVTSSDGRIRYPFADFMDLYTDGPLRIRKRRGKGAPIGTLPLAVNALHEFERVDPVTGNVTYYQIAATAAKIYLFSGGVFVEQTLPITVSAGAQWSFCNHNNRCYVVNGKDAAIDFDGTTWRVVGIDAPTFAPVYHLEGLVTFGRITAVNGSPTITITGAPIAGITSVGLVATATVAEAHHLSSGDVVRIAGAAPAAYNGDYAVVVTGTFTFTYAFAGGASPATGTITGFRHWLTGGVWDASPLDINGLRYRLSTVASLNTATLTEGFKETGAGNLTFVLYAGVMEWSEPLFYGFTYYDDVTGHSSDLSPRLQLTEKDQTGVTVVITIPASAQNQAAYQAGYHFIKLFRSYRNGTALVEMNVIINNVNSAVTPIVFTETVNTAKDTILTDFLAPEDINLKPPTALSVIASWMNRLVAIRPSDPTNTPPDAPRWYFSAISPEEVRFGVAEWCWPRRFNRSGIPQPRHLLTIGAGESSMGTLVIPSGNGDWTVEGYDQMTYTQPYRMATRRAGGFLFGAIDVDGELVELYRDKQLFHGGQDIGIDIQDKLNTISEQYIALSRLHHFSYQEDDALFVTLPRATTLNNYLLTLDYKRKRFNESNFGVTAFGSFHSAIGALEMWVGDSTGAVYRMFTNIFTDNGATYVPFFRSVPIHSETRKLTHRVHLYVNPAAAGQTWQLTFRFDEEAVGRTVTFTPAETGFQSAQGAELVYDFEEPVAWNTCDYAVIFPTSSADAYVESMVVIVTDEQQGSNSQ